MNPSSPPQRIDALNPDNLFPDWHTYYCSIVYFAIQCAKKKKSVQRLYSLIIARLIGRGSCPGQGIDVEWSGLATGARLVLRWAWLGWPGRVRRLALAT